MIASPPPTRNRTAATGDAQPRSSAGCSRCGSTTPPPVLAAKILAWVLLTSLSSRFHAVGAPPDKSGVKPSVISLPRGAGSIEGLGESFEPQLNTGGSSYGISIAIPPGRAALGPTIRLAYHSFSGNGICGVGWSLELPSVRRQTDKGFPEYDGGDTFVYGGEELTPLSNAGHDWRCENERSFQRLRQIDADGDGLPDAWEVTERNGTRHTLGRFRGQNNRWSVVEHPEKSGLPPFDRTFSWLIDATTDLHGNRIEYEYLRGPGILYPARITYGHLSNRVHEITFHYETRPDAFDDYRPTFSARWDRRLTRVEVRSQDRLVRAYSFDYQYQPGDLLPNEAALQSTYLDLGVTLLKRIVQLDRSGNDRNQLPPLVFTYSGLDLGRAELREFAAPPDLDLADPLGRVQIADLDGDALPDLFATTAEGATTVQRVALNRGESRINGRLKLTFAPSRIAVGSSPVDLAEPNTVVHDPRGKGLVDLSNLSTDGANKRLETFGNRARLDVADEDRLGFSPDHLEATVLPNPPAFVTYSSAATRQMDVNFDKRSDFVNLEPAFGAMKVHSYFLQRDGTWTAQESSLPPSYPLANTFQDASGAPNPCVHLADMNGDRLLDLVCLAPTPNGAGLRLRVSYWPLCGRGRYGEERPVPATEPDGFDILQADLRDVLIEDITGDGLADILILDGSGPETILTLRVNIAGQRWSPPYTRSGLPRFAPRDPGDPTLLRLADLNANGSVDLLFRNTSPDSWSYLELLPTGAPSLMSGIDNGLGKRTTVVYGSAAEDERLAREAGHPWRTYAPIALQVVRQIRTSTGLDLNGDGRPDVAVSEFRYRDPYYDGLEREFRGFAYAQRIDAGDDFAFDPVTGRLAASTHWDPSRTPTGQVSGPSLVSRFGFHTGAADQLDNDSYPGPPPPDRRVDEVIAGGGREEEALKGVQLVAEVVDPVVLHSAPDGDFDAGCRRAAMATTPEGRARLTPDDYVYSRAHQHWTLRRLYRPAEPLPYLADQNADGVLEDYRGTPAPVVPAGRFAPGGTTVLPGSGRSVTFAFTDEQVTELFEANGLLSKSLGYPAAPVARLLKQIDCDNYGNQTILRDLGVESPEVDDERVVVTTFAHGGNALALWIVNQPDTITIADEHGTVISRKTHYYDAEPFTGVAGAIQDRARLHKTVESPDSARTIVTTRSRYDGYGNLVESRDALGNVRRIDYDGEFQTYPIRETMVVGAGSPDLTMEAEYDTGLGTLVRARDFNGHLTEYFYDSFGRASKTVRPGDTEGLPTLSFEYLLVDPARGRAFSYDANGNLSVVQVPAGSASRVLTRQRLLPGSAAESITASFTDGAGKKLALVEQGDVDGQWIVRSATSFNQRGTPRSEWLPYRILQATAPGFTDLWPAGRPPEFDATRPVTSIDTEYTPTGKPIRRTPPPETDGGQRRQILTWHLPLEQWNFDEEDSLNGSPHENTPSISQTDGLGRVIRAVQRVRIGDDGRPTASPRRWQTTFDYDLNDQIIRIVDPLNNVRTFAYDGLKRRIRLDDPDRGTVRFTYDDASNLVESIDAQGRRITYTYDGIHRIRTEDYHDEGSGFSYGRSPDIEYIYDTPAGAVDHGDGTRTAAHNTRGRLAYVRDAAGEEHSSYDDRGRIEWTVKRLPDHARPPAGSTPSFVPYTTRFEYDGLDRVIRLVYPDLDEVRYEYNRRQLVSRILGGPSGMVISNISYAASGQPLRIDYGNGVVTSMAYDPRLRTVETQTLAPSIPAPVDLIHFQYRFDGASNLRAIDDRRSAERLPAGDRRRNTQSLEYDDLYRLTQVRYNPPAGPSANGGAITYRYSPLGTMLEQASDIDHVEGGRSLTAPGIMTHGGSAGSASRLPRKPGDPPGPHAITRVDHPVLGSRAFAYDDSGNMAGIDGAAFTWDFLDRLVAVDTATHRTEYRYDYSGRRVSKRTTSKPASGSSPGDPPTPHSAVAYPGAHFEVRENDEPTKYVFNGRTRVARVTGSLQSPGRRIQRFRIEPGWNLLSLGVEADDALVQLTRGPASGLDPRTVLVWNPSANEWRTPGNGAKLPTGSILWVHSSVAALVPVTGFISNGPSASLGAGSHFLPSPGLGIRRLRNPIPAPPSSPVDLWAFDAIGQTWRTRSTAVPEMLGTLPDVLPPGTPLFAVSAGPAAFVIDEPHLDIRYYHPDHLGSSSAITDRSGGLVEEIAYYPSGMPRVELHPPFSREPYTFGQQERDAESGLYYSGARYYSPELGRWITPDPAGAPDGLDPYQFARNSPLRYVDPTGYGSFDPEAAKALAGMLDIDPGDNFNWKSLSESGSSLKDALGQAREASKVEWEAETRGGPTWHDHVKNISAGFGDFVTPFPTRALRHAVGVEVDESSTLYKVAGGVGFVVGIASTFGASSGTSATTATTAASTSGRVSATASTVATSSGPAAGSSANVAGGIIRAGASRTAATEVAGGGGVFARTAPGTALAETAATPATAAAQQTARELQSFTQGLVDATRAGREAMWRYQTSAQRASSLNSVFEAAELIFYGPK